MTRSPYPLISSRRGARILVLLIPFLILSSLAWTRAVVFPKTSTVGVYERYSLRVVNERDVPIIGVEIRFPPRLRVSSFGDVPDWKLRILTDSAQNITGAAWTGVLPKARFVELPFLAMNPRDSASLSWPVYETYQGGERVEWTNPDTASKTPVSSTFLGGGAPVPVKCPALPSTFLSSRCCSRLPRSASPSARRASTSIRDYSGQRTAGRR